MTDNAGPTGAAAPPPTQTINVQSPAVPPANGMAVAGLVLGILALVFFWVPFLGWIPAILGLIFSLVGAQQLYGRGMAIGGLVCSAIALGIKVWFWIMLIGIFGAASAHHALNNF